MHVVYLGSEVHAGIGTEMQPIKVALLQGATGA